MTARIRPLTARPRLLLAVVVVGAAVAYALPFRQANCNTSAHYALVQTIASGTRTIDAVHGESCDISWWHGHYYANKAPGLALSTVPWYAAVKALGWVRTDTSAAASYPQAMRRLPRRDLWLMALWGAVLPALGLLLVVSWVANRLASGTGVVAAAVLGFGTLLLPFSSVFFSHALAAFLGFSAFALVLEGRGGLARPVAAGALAGYAVVVEYPLAILAVLLGAYVAAQSRSLRRTAAFVAGVVAGLVPLVVFNQWEFGSPLHLSYVGAVLIPGVTGHDVLGANSAGFFGVTMPRPLFLLEVLFSRRGLITVGPVVALAPLGCLLLWRRGKRAEAAFFAATGVAFLVYNAGYYSPLGGATPGPRFLIPMLPFAALAVAPVARALPLTTAVLGVGSAAILLAAHLTQPLISQPYTTGDWWLWVRTGSFTSTLLDPASHSWLPGVPIVLAVVAALAAAAATIRIPARLDRRPALVSLAAWIAILVISSYTA